MRGKSRPIYADLDAFDDSRWLISDASGTLHVTSRSDKLIAQCSREFAPTGFSTDSVQSTARADCCAEPPPRSTNAVMRWRSDRVRCRPAIRRLPRRQKKEAQAR